jgi:hypothetical protein
VLITVTICVLISMYTINFEIALHYTCLASISVDYFFVSVDVSCDGFNNKIN